MQTQLAGWQVTGFLNLLAERPKTGLTLHKCCKLLQLHPSAWGIKTDTASTSTDP